MEWIIFFAGLILLAGIITYLSYQWIRFSEGAPVLEFSVEAVPEMYDPGRHQLQVYNKGGQTVKEVEIEASLWREQQLLNKVYIRLDLLPRHSARTAWFSFQQQPLSSDSVGIHALSYQ